MTASEKWAVWTLGVVGLTAIIFFAVVAVYGKGEASQAVFALLALTAVPASSRRKFKGRQFDEREKEIASKALLAGFRAVWLVCIAYVLWMGLANGWETGVTMPAWMFSEFLWLLAMLLLAVEALTTLVLYRRGNHV